MDKFIDPRNGKFDASDWLLHHRGFLPVPIIVTEPAVGYGGGAALLFFHQSIDEKRAGLQTDSGGDNIDGKKKKAASSQNFSPGGGDNGKRQLGSRRFSFRKLERGPYPIYGRRARIVRS